MRTNNQFLVFDWVPPNEAHAAPIDDVWLEPWFPSAEEAADTEPVPETVPSARLSLAVALPPLTAETFDGLFIDLVEPRLYYRGHRIPTTGPGNIQRLPFLALAALARRRGETLSMPDLAREIALLGGRPRAMPVGSDVRYGILRPMRRWLKGRVDHAEIEGLVETVPRRGLRMHWSLGTSMISAGREAAAVLRRLSETPGGAP